MSLHETVPLSRKVHRLSGPLTFMFSIRTFLKITVVLGVGVFVGVRWCVLVCVLVCVCVCVLVCVVVCGVAR